MNKGKNDEETRRKPNPPVILNEAFYVVGHAHRLTESRILVATLGVLQAAVGLRGRFELPVGFRLVVARFFLLLQLRVVVVDRRFFDENSRESQLLVVIRRFLLEEEVGLISK